MIGDRLGDTLGQLSSTDSVVGVVYLAIIAAVAGETTWRYLNAGTRRSGVVGDAVTAAAMAAGGAVVGLGWAGGLAALWSMWARLTPEAVTVSWSQRPALAALTAFIAWDAAAWLYHWTGHHSAVGWAAHRPHHTGGFDLTVGLRQSWTPVWSLVIYPPLAVLGISFETMVAAAALSNLWQFAVHTSVPFSVPGPVAALVITPAAHRHHHGRPGAPVNLGAVLTVWDRLAGTWVPHDVPAPEAYGTGDRERNPLRIQAAGWSALLSGRHARSEPAPHR